ncbi:competence type IV pilus assembly protein ComGB [Streptococcus dentiloxodontae]
MTWLRKDISPLNRFGVKKLKLAQQAKIIELFNNLLTAGFTLSEILDFLERSQLLEDKYTAVMRQSLLSGQSLSAMLETIGFSDQIVTQISLADKHGDLQGSLEKIESYLNQMAKVKQKLVEVATYPALLMGFLVLIMLGLKNYLLPQLAEGKSNLATQLVSLFPQIFFGFIISLMIIVALVIKWAKRKPAVTVYSLLMHLPLIGKSIQLYLSAYYAREWGNLLGQGVELIDMVKLMQSQKDKLFQEIGSQMEAALLAGQSFPDKVASYSFFAKELSLIIEYGQVKSRLGSELNIFSDEIWQRFFSRMTKATAFVQPLIFILVALIIVMIYAAMLLPMYQNMEGLTS